MSILKSLTNEILHDSPNARKNFKFIKHISNTYDNPIICESLFRLAEVAYRDKDESAVNIELNLLEGLYVHKGEIPPAGSMDGFQSDPGDSW